MASIVTVWTLYHGRVDGPAAAPRATPRVTTTAPIAAASTLWLLAIGVSRYRQGELNLQFAAADARAIAATLQLQSAGPLYREAKTLLLTDEEVTRESILNSLDRFLGQAGPDDVAAIFVAGHGVQDQASGSYYFLPFAATAQNLVSTGLRMSDFDEMVRVVRHNVRAVVVMLDTCHAGALRLSASNLVAADDPTARMSAGEGFFLLAATKPGEDSMEEPSLGHGAFTYALLEGLRGAADANSDGLITASDLFGYVAQRVPQLTAGAQHPYHKEEGTDLVFAAVEPAAGALAAAPTVEAASPPLSRVATPAINTIGVMEFRDLRDEAEHDWIGKALRVALNTELSKVRALRVYSPELIDRATASRHVDDLTTAQRLGIRTLITGSFHLVGNTVRIDAEIVDTASGVQEGSDSVQGDVADFFALQKKLVLSMLRRLRVELTAAEGASIEQRTNTNVDAYRLLLEAEGIVEEPTVPPTPEHSAVPSTPHAWWHDGLRRFAALLVRRALAEEPAGDPAAEVRQVLAAYRAALEHKDLDKLVALYVSFSARQREALRAYLDNATGLSVEISDIAIEPRGDEVAVSYTRRDRFVDKESAKPQHLEVRLTKILVRQNGAWKISGGR